MSGTIDNEVVRMEFDNSNFESNVSASMGTLEKLKKALNFDSIGASLKSLNDQAGKVDLDALNRSANVVQNRFSNLGMVATGALMQIGSTAVQVGATVLKAMTVQPLIDGFREYEQTMNSTKTIMANLPNETMDHVTDTLNQLNKYADDTIYSFSDMTTAIGQFTAAGVDLDRATTAIKGLSNVAAGAGANNTALARAEYQVSQALQAGTFRLMDWNSLVQAGMANPEMQEQLKQTAREYGVDVDSIIAKQGSFRDSLQEGWLSADIFIDTMAKAADTTNEWGARLQDAATQVNTFSQLMSVISESIGSSWAQTWEIILGDYEESKKLFTDLYNIIDPFIQALGDARNAEAQAFVDAGGREAVINTITTSLTALFNIVDVLGQKFGWIFDGIGTKFADTAKKVSDGATKFKEFTDALKSGNTDAIGTNLLNTFDGISVIVKGILGIIGQVGHIIDRTIGVAGKLGTIILRVTGFLGDQLDTADKLGEFDGIIENISDAIDIFFDTIDKGLDSVDKFASNLDTLRESGFKLPNIFTNITGVVSDALSAIKDFMSQATNIDGDGSFDVWTVFKNGLDGFGNVIKAIVDKLSDIYTYIFGKKSILTVVTQLINIFGLLGFARGLNNVANFVGNVSKVFKNIAGSLGGISKAGSGIRFAGIAALVGAMALAITSIVNSISTLSSISTTEGFGPAVAVVAGVMGVLIAAVALFMYLNNKQSVITDGEKTGNMLHDVLSSFMSNIFSFLDSISKAASLISVAALIASLVFAVSTICNSIKELSELPADGIQQAGTVLAIAIGGLLGSVAALMELSKKTEGVDLGTIASVVALTYALKTITEAIMDLSGSVTNNFGGSIAAVAIIEGVLWSLVGLVKVISNITGKEFNSNVMFSVLSIGVFVHNLSDLITSISEMTDTIASAGLDNTVSALAIVEAIMWSLVGIVKAMTKLSGDAAPAASSAIVIAALCWSLKNVADAISSVAQTINQYGHDANKAFDVIELIIIELGTVATLMSQYSSKFYGAIGVTGVILALSYSLQFVATAITELADSYSDNKKTKRAVQDMEEIIFLLAGCATIMSQYAGKFSGAIGASLTVLALAHSLSDVSDATSEIASLYENNKDTKRAIQNMEEIIFLMAGCATIMSQYAGKFSGAIGSAAAVIALAEALKVVGDAFSTFTNVYGSDPESAEGAMGVMLAMLSSMVGVIATLNYIGMGAGAAIGNATAVLLVAISLNAIAAALNSMPDAESAIGSVDALSVMLFALSGALSVLAQAGPVALAAGGSMSAVILCLSLLAVAVGSIQDYSGASDYMRSLGEFAVLLAGALSVLSGVGPVALAAGAAMSAVTLCFALLSVALSTIDDPEGATQVIEAYSGFTVALGVVLAALGALGPTADLAAAALILVGVAFELMADAMAVGAAALASSVDTVDKLSDVLVKIEDLDDSAPDKLRDILVKLGEGLGADTLGAFGGADALSTAVDALDKLSNSLSKYESIDSGTGDNIKNVLSSIGEGLNSVSMFAGDQATSIDIAIAGIDKLSESINKWGRIGDDTGDNIKDVLMAIGEGLNSVSSFSGDKANSVAIACTGISELGDTINKWKNISSDTATSIETVLSAIGTGLGKVTNPEAANAFSTMVEPLGTLADSVSKWKDVSVSPEYIGQMIGTLATNVGYMNGDTDGAKNMETISGPLGTLGESVSSWSEVSVDPNYIGWIIATLATNIRYMNDIGSGATNLSTISAPLSTLSTSLSSWSEVSVDPNYIGWMIATLATNIRYMNDIGDGADNLSTIAGPLSTVATSLTSWDDVAISPDFVGWMIATLATNIGYMNEIGDGADALSTIAAPLGTVASALISWNNVTISPDTVGWMLGTLATNIGYMNGIGDGADNLDTISEPLSTLAYALVTWNNVTVSPDTVGWMLGTLATNIGYMNGIGDGADALSTISDPLITLANALVTWSSVTISPDMVGWMLGTLATNIGYFADKADGASVISSLPDPLNELAAACGTLSAVDGALVQATLTAISDGLNTFASGTADEISTISTNLDSFGASCQTLSDNATAASDSITAMATSISSAYSAISSGFDSVGTSATAASSAVGYATENMISSVSNTSSTILTIITTTGATALTYAIQNGSSISTGFANGISNGSPLAYSAAMACVNAAKRAFASAGSTYDLGQNFAAGFALGIRSKINAIAQAAHDVVKAGIDSAKNTQLSASPSKVTRRLGGYFSMGFAVGIKDKTDMAVDAASTAVQAAINSVSNQVDDVDGFQATITPVVDDSYFTDSINSLNTALNMPEPNITQDVTNNYSDILNAITDLKSSFDRYAEITLSNPRNVTSIDKIIYNDDEQIQGSVENLLMASRRRAMMNGG
jgi:tape measure domain-containing protein